MSSTKREAIREHAEAKFKKKERQKADAPAAMTDYIKAQDELLTNMHRLRQLRQTAEQETRRPKPRGLRT